MPLFFLAVAGFAFLLWKSNRNSDTDSDTPLTVNPQDIFEYATDIEMGASTKTVSGFVGGVATPIEVSAIGGGLYMRSDAAAAFLRMVNAARLDGVALKPSGPRSAFRTTDQQASLQDTGFAAPINHSHHQMGTCIDLETAQGTNEAYDWLIANAEDFGFRGTVPVEPWHWEFIR